MIVVLNFKKMAKEISKVLELQVKDKGESIATAVIPL
jgi:hypothetical protein